MSFGIEIYNFITDDKNENSIDIDDYGNAIFQADIQYEFRNQILHSTTGVKIIRNGYDDGKISLNENDELNVNFLHLDFTPYYQKYSYDLNDHSLNIAGTSEKMSGGYSIKITI